MQLVAEAARNLARHMNVAVPDLRGAREWLAQAERHRLPLYALAAAIHAVLSPKDAFGFGGGDLLKKLALREGRRIQRASPALGLGAEGLERLLALGVLADGLGESTIMELAKAGVCDGTTTDIVGALARSPWWKNGRLIRLEPDAPAAAFVDAMLFGPSFPNGRAALSDWLFIALQENAATFGNRLGRILYDLHILDPTVPAAHPLDAKLVQMVEKKPERAVAFAMVASTEVPFWTANFAAHVALILAEGIAEPETKAIFLNNGANYLSVLGRREAALGAAQEAVGHYRDLALARPEAIAVEFARSLWVVGDLYADDGRPQLALTSLHEGIACLSSVFAAVPAAVVEIMQGLLQSYLTQCEALTREPDEALLAPIIEIFQRMSVQDP